MRLAELHPAGGREPCRRGARHQPRHGPHRGALLKLQRPSRPCVRGRPGTDRAALLHQFGIAETPAEVAARASRLEVSVPQPEPISDMCYFAGRFHSPAGLSRRGAMSLGTSLIVLVILYLLGGWSG